MSQESVWKLGLTVSKKLLWRMTLALAHLLMLTTKIFPLPHFYLVYLRWRDSRSQPTLYVFLPPSLSQFPLFLSFLSFFVMVLQTLNGTDLRHTKTQHLVKSDEAFVICPIQIYSHSIGLHGLAFKALLVMCLKTKWNEINEVSLTALFLIRLK